MTLGDRIAVLRGGVLQQVADPFELYQRPSNQFVAGFIGSPSINFFSASLRGEGAANLWDASGVALNVPAPLAVRLAAWGGTRVTLGIRPEDVGLVPQGSGVALPGTVEVREPLGNEVLVHWSTPVGELVSRLTGDRVPQVGERAELHLPYGKLHWFDPETERALDGAASPA